MKKLLIPLLVLLIASAGLAQYPPRVDRYTAATYIPEGFAVAVNAAGYAVIADSLTNTNFVGIAFRAADGLQTVEVIPSGQVTNTSRWNFTVGNPVYIGMGGNLQDAIEAGPSVGMAVGTHTVMLGNSKATEYLIHARRRISADTSIFANVESTKIYIPNIKVTDLIFTQVQSTGGMPPDTVYTIVYKITTDTLRLYAPKKITRTVSFLRVVPW